MKQRVYLISLHALMKIEMSSLVIEYLWTSPIPSHDLINDKIEICMKSLGKTIKKLQADFFGISTQHILQQLEYS